MNEILNKYKKSAYLSFQLIVYYRHLKINDDNIVLFLAELFRGMLFKWKGENKKSHQK